MPKDMTIVVNGDPVPVTGPADCGEQLDPIKRNSRLFKDSSFYIFEKFRGFLMKSGGWCMAQTIDSADKFTYTEMRKAYVGINSVVLVVGETPKLPEGKKSMIEWHFSPQVIELIKAAPNSPLVRAHIMKVAKAQPPNEANDYELLKDWLEKNVEEKLLKGVDLARPRPANPARRNVNVVLELEYRGSRTEMGGCNYSCIGSGSGLVQITQEDIDDWRNNELTSDEVMDIIQQRMNDDDFDWQSTEDYDYSDYEFSDADDYEYNLSRRRTDVMREIENLLA
jgi:hypothetical protein